jgi:hypothetical protein
MRTATLSTVLAWMALSAALPSGSLWASEPDGELKAAVVLSFLRYGEWQQPSAANSPLTVGVLGRASVVEVLRRTLEGKSANNRAIRVVELKTGAEAQSCQAVYFATDNVSEIRAVLQGPPPLRALTIGETKDFLDAGGAVQLMVIDGHMGFEANLEALDRASVSISSKLLRFGQVRNRTKGDRK